MSKKRRKKYSDIDSHYIPAMIGNCPKPIRKIMPPAEMPFSKDGYDSNNVLYADDYYHNNRYRLDDKFNNTGNMPIVK